MSLFFRLFDTGIPWTIIVSTILVAFVTTCIVVWLHKENRQRYVLIVWIVAYIFLMLYSTVIGREARASVSVHLMPFWSIGAIQSGLIEILYEKIYNVLFFVPYGFLLGASPLPSHKEASPLVSHEGKGVRWKRVVLIGCLTSVAIELLQLITRTGMCETDDVICNTVGCGIGSLLALGILKIYKKIANGKKE